MILDLSRKEKTEIATILIEVNKKLKKSGHKLSFKLKNNKKTNIITKHGDFNGDSHRNNN